MQNKALGQHWLKDSNILKQIADSAQITPQDTVLEIGPGLGTLTSELLRRAKCLEAVEIDPLLAHKLPGQFPGKDLTVHNTDILQFDLNNLPAQYVVVANVPYYITSKIIQKLMTAQNKPRTTVLLIQKEVAKRLAAKPGNMSILAISAQIYAEVSLGIEVGSNYFTPPPEVDSQVVILKTLSRPLVSSEQEKKFFSFIKAGFSAKRKKLRSSLAGGLGIDKSVVEVMLNNANISPDLRAEDLSIAQWLSLTK